tara:strand:- start:4416 stop:4619 length:204 start_codon:yes stop_codon:yes gene_type:complete
MNIKEEKSKEFLRLNKILRELRLLRFTYFGTKKQKAVETAIQALGPLCDELKHWLDNADKPDDDYDL